MSATVLDSQADCGARHAMPSRSRALRMVSSLRMAAVSASFLGRNGVRTLFGEKRGPRGETGSGLFSATAITRARLYFARL